MTTTALEKEKMAAALSALLAGEPPKPCRERFQPLRLGLLGIWQYDEQEFVFHDGRMVLRGRNGSGKTKVLEVTSPFLFDANLTARRLDPFGSAARSMRDNLLYGSKSHQIGYVWCEYGRLQPDGTMQYLTLGAGMRAQAAKNGSPDTWYFLTDQRAGVDFKLYDSARRPANDKVLAERLGPHQVFSTADAYRRAVGRDLFGLTPDRFRSLVELLITLRRPKLSENFGVEKLTAFLSDGLPPVDYNLVDELARGFDELARDQEDLQKLEHTKREVDRFLNGYRVYARKMVRYVAGKVRAAVTRFDDVTRQKHAAEAKLAESEKTVAHLEARAAELQLTAGQEAARIRTLEQRPEVAQHQAMLLLRKQAATTEEQARRAKARLADATRELESMAEELAAAEQDLAVSLARQEELNCRAGEEAEGCGLSLEHEVQAERLHDDSAAARRILEAVVDSRRSAVRETRRLVRVVDQAQISFDRAQATRDDLVARREAAADAVERQQGQLNEEIEAVSTAVVSWAGECREHRWSDSQLDGLLDSVKLAGEPGAPVLAELVRQHSAVLEGELFRERAQHEQALKALRDKEGELNRLREQVVEERDLPPPPPLVERRDRMAGVLPGLPLWRSVDFSDDVAETVRNQVEAALLGAGLLDAWLTPEGSVLAADTLDVVLRPGKALKDGVTLAAVLRPAQQGEVAEDVVLDVLAGIRYGSSAAPNQEEVAIGADGSWTVGLLSGRTRGGPASYIGATARQAARQRRLAELDLKLAEVAQAIEILNELLGRVTTRRARLLEERNSCATDEPVRAARAALDAAIRTAAQFAEEARRSEERLLAKRDELRTAVAALDSYAGQHTLGTTIAALDHADAALTSYREAVADLMAQVAQTRNQQSRAIAARSRTDRQRARTQTVTEEHEQVRALALDLAMEYATRREMSGASVDQVMAELETARSTQNRIAAEKKEADSRGLAAAQELGAARSTLQAIEHDRRRREEDRLAAVAEFDKVRRQGFLELVQVFGMSSGAVSLTRSVDEARQAEQVLHEEDISEKARNAGRNQVDERFRELTRQIDGPDWRPWGDNDGELFVVRVTHNGLDRTVPELVDLIQNEIETRQSYLDERERRLFAEVLLGRIGEHLRRCRVEANSLRDRMNHLLLKQPTASGMQMRLRWEPDPEAGPDVGRAILLLDQQATRFLTDEARDELVGFLSARVRQTRDNDQVGDWRVHLREALDYRKWSRFRLEVRHGAGGRWADLTDSKHQQGSGGEKAVMLQLPLFVAAAAHYQGAAKTAPHPIYLDEAFAGIDAEMRGSCMKLLGDLDLDFILASHDEWGFHAEVPGLVTYSLFRDPSAPGVLTTPFVWDGVTSHHLDDPALQ
ncbi:TIGR02680 family protein [Crossiella sp. CA198]|uniref:TIGR02680 family protein n=1 Tax=Crossiella sp. CA198 TaxID=3455607 RepID=UPI003F8D06F6